MDVNGMSLARCIYNCEENGDCENECVAQFKGHTADCPCEVSLLLTLQIITFIIKENCPAGCPCDSYECEDITTTVSSTTSVGTTTTWTEPVAKDAVLMLNTKSSDNIPMVIGLNGK